MAVGVCRLGDVRVFGAIVGGFAADFIILKLMFLSVIFVVLVRVYSNCHHTIMGSNPGKV